MAPNILDIEQKIRTMSEKTKTNTARDNKVLNILFNNPTARCKPGQNQRLADCTTHDQLTTWFSFHQARSTTGFSLQVFIKFEPRQQERQMR